MKSIIEHFRIGPYVGLEVESKETNGETGYINGLVDRIIEGSVIAFSEEELDRQVPEVVRQLSESLEADRKPVRLYCYLNNISEKELPAFTRENMKRTAAENSIIRTIVSLEKLEATEQDMAAYKRNYREEYARALLGNPTLTDEDLKLAIETKKALSFLMKNNVWRRVE